MPVHGEKLELDLFYFTDRIWSNVIQHLSYNIANNFFINKIGDHFKMKYHSYRKTTTMSMYIKPLLFLIHAIYNL